jgi:hypothetical protein
LLCRIQSENPKLTIRNTLSSFIGCIDLSETGLPISKHQVQMAQRAEITTAKIPTEGHYGEKKVSMYSQEFYLFSSH